MGAHDGDGDIYSWPEGIIRRFLEEKGRPLDSKTRIYKQESLRYHLGLTREDIATILGRALLKKRLTGNETFGDFTHLLFALDALLDNQLKRIRKKIRRKNGRKR